MSRLGGARWALWLLLLLVTSELGARLALAVVGDRFSGEIRSKRVIYAEQSLRISQLVNRPNRLLVFDSILGWRYRAGHQDPDNTTNQQGLRSLFEYTPAPGPGILRVAAFGDSFVYSNEVGNEDAWPAQLERDYPGIEVLNYGVGGYGVDQAYLRFLGEPSRSPRVVLIGFTPDDITRVVNVYRRFRSNQEIPLVKPRFVLDSTGQLVLLPCPLGTVSQYQAYLDEPSRVTELGTHDWWYEPLVYRNPFYDYSAAVRIATEIWVQGHRRLGADRMMRDGRLNPRSEAFRIQVALFQLFADSVRGRESLPMVLLLPDRDAVASALAREPTVLEPLKQALRAHRLEFLDATDAFVESPNREGIRGWFMPGGHYSPTGNGLVARWLGRRLQDLSRSGH